MNIKKIIYILLLTLFMHTANAGNSTSTLQTGTYSVLNKVQKDIEEIKKKYFHPGLNLEVLKTIKFSVSSGPCIKIKANSSIHTLS